MKPEKQSLLDDLLADDRENARRDSAIHAGGQILQRRRWKRAATQSLCVLACFTSILLAILTLIPSSPSRRAQNPVPSAASRPMQAHALTDDELLALFPNTPVGLITKADGKKKLIFPRPGDEERCIVHL